MPNQDGSEKAKISDSAYSIGSHSQSRRSRSSKSTHSGSHSSVSSGYGGKPSSSDSGFGEECPAAVRFVVQKKKTCSQIPNCARSQRSYLGDGRRRTTTALQRSPTASDALNTPGHDSPLQGTTRRIRPRWMITDRVAVGSDRELATLSNANAPSNESSGDEWFDDALALSSSKAVPTPKKEKEIKRKWVFEKPALLECRPPEPIAPNMVKNIKAEKLEDMDVTPPLSMPDIKVENVSVAMEEGSNIDAICDTQNQVMEVVTPHSREIEGFSCAISMVDGVVMYATQNIYTNLGFPKDMWIGRSFIEFVHPRDRETFASQITKSVAAPQALTADAAQQEANSYLIDVPECRMACRIRRYRTLSVGFATANRTLSYVPFVLKISFKDIKDDIGSMVYLLVKATPLYPAYKSPSELLMNPTPFVIRHSATGSLEYLDIASVPYLGYLPQDVHNQDALMMYHPDDLPVLKIVYEDIVKYGGLAKTKPYRMLTQNGDYVKLETEWTSFTNPWSMKLEFILGKHFVLEGPLTPDVFKAPPPAPEKSAKLTDEEKEKIEATQLNKNQILKTLKEVLTKPADIAKEHNTKRVQDMATMLETILDEPNIAEELRIDTQDGDIERDSVILGGISPHHENGDSISSIATPMSYNQLNYNENLQRYFDSHLNTNYNESNPSLLVASDSADGVNNQKLTVDAGATSRLSPMALHSTDSLDISPPSSMNSSTIPTLSEFLPARLTESLLIKHNNDMEKELAKNHRETRSANKANRTSDNKQKTKEHLARCNASYQPTVADGVKEAIPSHAQKKRHLKNLEGTCEGTPAKQTCLQKATENFAPHQHLPPNSNFGLPLPIYYPRVTPVTPKAKMPTSIVDAHFAQNLVYPQISHLNYQPTHMPWSYPEPVFGYTGYMYSPIALNMQHQDQLMVAQSNEARTSPMNLTVNKPAPVKDEPKHTAPSFGFEITKPKLEPKPIPEPPKPAVEIKVEKPTGPSDEDNINKTDEESSYSSFYSSFLKTESSSMRSSEAKKPRLEPPKKEVEPGYTYEPMPAKKTAPKEKNPPWLGQEVEPGYTYEPMPAKKTAPKEKNPPWLGQANASPNFQYKYQVPTKTKGDTLENLTAEMSQIDQSCVVNDQLGHLYEALNLEGVTTGLTLEEGITSTTSSGASSLVGAKPQTRKRDYTKLTMIYEENAPLPSPSVSEAPIEPSPPSSDKEPTSDMEINICDVST